MTIEGHWDLGEYLYSPKIWVIGDPFYYKSDSRMILIRNYFVMVLVYIVMSDVIVIFCDLICYLL